MVLKSGSVLVAAKTGHALPVHGSDQMIVSLNSMVAVPQDRGRITTVMESFGEIEFDVSHQAKPHFVVKTPFLAAVVKGTHFKVRVLRRGGSVTVTRGRVEVSDLVSGEHVDVLPGQTALVKPGRRLALIGPGIHAPIQPGKGPGLRFDPFSPSGVGTRNAGLSGARGAGDADGVGGVSAVSGGGTPAV
jgi:hypothetical protein